MKRTVYLLIAFLLLCSFASAEIASNIFSHYDVSARARGRGGAFVASGNDANALFYNIAALHSAPAGLISSYSNIFGNDFQAFSTAAFSYHMPRWGTIGLGIKTLAVEYGSQTLQEEATYSLGHAFTVVSDVHSQLYFGYAITMNHLSFGKTVTGATMGDESVLGLNLSLLATLHNRTQLGVVVENINNPTVGKGRTHDLPQTLTLGIAYVPYPKVTTEISLQQKFSEETKIMAGIEYTVNNFISLRSGASTYPNSISGGVSLHFKGMSFDYAVNSHPVLDATHQFALGYQFSK